MHFEPFSLVRYHIDGVRDYDVVTDGDEIRAQKKPSKQFRNGFGHTPLSIERTFLGNAGGW